MFVDRSEAKDIDRNLFNIGNTESVPSYDPNRLSRLADKQHKINLEMFDLINEAAVRRDPAMKYWLELHGKSLGVIPQLAAAHYYWVFGDESKLDWLLAEQAKSGLGRDSLILIVFGYMDEWDRTLRVLKENARYIKQHGDGAASEVHSRALFIRKKLYGNGRFDKAWKALDRSEKQGRGKD